MPSKIRLMPRRRGAPSRSLMLSKRPSRRRLAAAPQGEGASKDARQSRRSKSVLAPLGEREAQRQAHEDQARQALLRAPDSGPAPAAPR